MANSTNAYIVGMTDSMRDELVAALQQTGYGVSQTDPHLRVLTQGGRHHNRPEVVVVDVAALTPDSVANLCDIRSDLPGTTVVLMSQRASQTLDGDDLPDGIWGLVSKTASAQSVQDLVGFLSGRQQTIH